MWPFGKESKSVKKPLTKKEREAEKQRLEDELWAEEEEICMFEEEEDEN